MEDFFDVPDLFRRKPSKSKGLRVVTTGPTPDLTHDAAWYLYENGGDVAYFHHHRRGAQRLGQAFFNALSPADQRKVEAAELNVFYDDASLPATLRLLQHG